VEFALVAPAVFSRDVLISSRPQMMSSASRAGDDHASGARMIATDSANRARCRAVRWRCGPRLYEGVVQEYIGAQIPGAVPLRNLYVDVEELSCVREHQLSTQIDARNNFIPAKKCIQRGSGRSWSSGFYTWQALVTGWLQHFELTATSAYWWRPPRSERGLY